MALGKSPDDTSRLTLQSMQTQVLLQTAIAGLFLIESMHLHDGISVILDT
jgi:hypothetical protein